MEDCATLLNYLEISKHQIPNPKFQTSSKFQIPSTKPFGTWDLVLEVCLVIGIWCLVISLIP